MNNSAKNTTLLELHVPDFKKAKEFYGKLGFKVVWERKPDEKKGYLVLKKENNILCFWPGNDYVDEHEYFGKFPKNTKRGYGVEIVIMIKNINNFYAKAKSFANIVEALQVKPWGLKDFRIEDPFGFYIRFTEPHNIFDEDDNSVK